MIEVRQTKTISNLQGTLLDACPPDADGNVSIPILAGWLGLSSWGVYKWLHDGKVPPGRVQQLIDLQQRHFGEVRAGKAALNPIFA